MDIIGVSYRRVNSVTGGILIGLRRRGGGQLPLGGNHTT